MNTPGFTIAAVERDTGLSKDVLRMWERRYGFPVPERDAHGERVYPAAQVERLRAIKRLMDQGYRPGKLIATPIDELSLLAPRRGRPAVVEGRGVDHPEHGELLALLRQHDANAFVQALQQRLARQGLQRFVQDIVAPLTQQVGDAWEDGHFEVFEEHLFTELTKRVLRQAIAGLPQGGASPRVLLTSVPDEQHMLGLLMVEALLALEGAECIPLGTQMPLLEISRAAAAHRADIVALSFSVAFPARQLPRLLEQLRAALSADVELWVGGRGVSRLNPPAGVRCFASLDQGVEALAAWRSAHAG
ncbi:MerR family transcriptional regulator [Zoogloea sp.]|uniref:MerR family transcriptional regulator n=1 Tax=Zoogloea sp. TaxID=49181 RepID=UPI0035B244F1